MTGRRRLGETLGEIAGGALDIPGEAARLLQVTSFELSLPIDIRLVIDPDGPVVIGDVPLTHLRTDFDPPPMRLDVTWVARPVEVLP